MVQTCFTSPFVQKIPLQWTYCSQSYTSMQLITGITCCACSCLMIWLLLLLLVTFDFRCFALYRYVVHTCAQVLCLTHKCCEFCKIITGLSEIFISLHSIYAYCATVKTCELVTCHQLPGSQKCFPRTFGSSPGRECHTNWYFGIRKMVTGYWSLSALN